MRQVAIHAGIAVLTCGEVAAVDEKMPSNCMFYISISEIYIYI